MGTINRIKESLADLGDSIVNKTDEEEPTMGTDDLFEDNPPDDAEREKFDEEVKQVMGESEVQEPKTFPMPDKIIDIEKTLETIAVNGSTRTPYDYETKAFRYLLENDKYENFVGNDAREAGGQFSLIRAKAEGWIEVIGKESVFNMGKETTKKIKNYRINPKFIVWNGNEDKAEQQPITKIKTITTKQLAPTIDFEFSDLQKENKLLIKERELLTLKVERLNTENESLKTYDLENPPDIISHLETVINERTLILLQHYIEDSQRLTSDRLDILKANFRKEWNNLAEYSPDHPILTATKNYEHALIKRVGREMDLSGYLIEFKREADNALRSVFNFDGETLKGMDNWAHLFPREREPPNEAID